MSNGTPIEVSDKEMLKRQSEELCRMRGIRESLEGRLQDEQRYRLRAENVISLIGHSTIGNYDWCKSVCMDYLNR